MYEMLVGYPPFYSEDAMMTCRKIVNWRTQLVFPDDVQLSSEAIDLMRRFMCDVDHRIGSQNGPSEIKAHPFFNGIDWEQIYDGQAAYKPDVKGDLDTSNFEQFEEDAESNAMLRYVENTIFLAHCLFMYIPFLVNDACVLQLAI